MLQPWVNPKDSTMGAPQLNLEEKPFPGKGFPKNFGPLKAFLKKPFFL